MSDQPEVSLVDELLADLNIRKRGKRDYEIRSIIRNSTENPDTYRAKLYFGFVNRILKAKQENRIISFSEAIDETDLRRSISIGGAGIKYLIDGQLAKQGVSSRSKVDLPRPTLYDKMFRQEAVKKYEKQEAENLDLE